MKNRNIEEQLADKLGSRSIKPSEQAWDRIVRNRQQGKQKKQKNRTVIYHAASIVLLMLFTGYFLGLGNINNNVITEPVVNSGKKETIINEDKPSVMPEKVLPPAKTEAVIVYNGIKRDADPQNQGKKGQESIILPYKGLEVNENLPDINIAALPVVNSKTLNKEEYYEQEAAYLLDNAIKDVAISRKSSAPVNDTALLKEVEAEMDQYYREKALRIFSLKHKTIRIAVKDRN